MFIMMHGLHAHDQPGLEVHNKEATTTRENKTMTLRHPEQEPCSNMVARATPRQDFRGTQHGHNKH